MRPQAVVLRSSSFPEGSDQHTCGRPDFLWTTHELLVEACGLNEVLLFFTGWTSSSLDEVAAKDSLLALSEESLSTSKTTCAPRGSGAARSSLQASSLAGSMASPAEGGNPKGSHAAAVGTGGNGKNWLRSASGQNVPLHIDAIGTLDPQRDLESTPPPSHWCGIGVGGGSHDQASSFRKERPTKGLLL